MLDGESEGFADGATVGAATHKSKTQALLRQSSFSEQFLPNPQGGHSIPPQSTSVSFPLITPSLQDNEEGLFVGTKDGDPVGITLGEREGEEEGSDVTSATDI